MPGFHHDAFILCLAFIIAVLSVARTVRLWIFDDFPPVAWLRVRFLARFEDDSPWAKLAECPFCVAPYFAAGMFAWGWACDLAWWWWLINAWWGLSYLAAILVVYDQPE